MGYTHYYSQDIDFTIGDWQTICDDIKKIISYTQNELGIGLAGGDGSGKPSINTRNIMFNGLGDNAHETFYIARKGAGSSDFCKTARKGYDVTVTAILCYLSSVAESHYVTSDGEGTDFVMGLALAKQALPNYSNQLDIPIGVMQEDRWCQPYPSLYTSDYFFGFCVDGYAYITKGDRHYRFHSHYEAAKWTESHIEKHIKVQDWQGRTIREGGKSLFNPMGFFDEKRRNSLIKQQEAVLSNMLDNMPASRNIAPPAYVRPDELAKLDEMPRCHSLSDILKLGETTKGETVSN